MHDRKCIAGEHHEQTRRVTFPFVVETEALTSQHTTSCPDLVLTLNSHRNTSWVSADLRLSFPLLLSMQSRRVPQLDAARHKNQEDI